MGMVVLFDEMLRRGDLWTSRSSLRGILKHRQDKCAHGGAVQILS